jgi:dihydroflavonol-4-reductase
MVLVTGASGFLGQHLVRYLSAQGIPVRALYHRHAPDAELRNLPAVEWMQCDLLDVYAVEEAMKDIDEVYHCAAIVTFDTRRRDEMLHFNPESTANVVNEALARDIRKMVYVSSVAALGRTGNGAKTITEEEEWGESMYNSAYGISKYLAENEVWRGVGEGLNAVIVNPGIILGPGNGRDLAARMIKMAYREFPFYSKGVSSFVDVADVVKILVKLMQSDIEAERFIISGANTSFREIFTLMAGAMNKKPPRWYANSFMTGIAWRLSSLRAGLSGKTSIITRETVNNANSVSLYDNSKLLKALPGFTYTPINHSVESMARSFIDFNKK